MPTRPRLYRGSKLTGLAAVALFGVLAAVFLTAEFGTAAAFEPGTSITASIGYAMFNLPVPGPDGLAPEGFLATFFIVAVVLDAALEGAVMLAKRDDESGGDD
jgi:NADH-quinone oxidoreductase subunit J